MDNVTLKKKLSAYISDAGRLMHISALGGQSFRFQPDTDFGASRTVISVPGGH